MVKGIRRDGSWILPVMPYEKYSGMAQEDLKALIAYLRTLKPVKKPTPDSKPGRPSRAAWALRSISKSLAASVNRPPRRRKAASSAAVISSTMCRLCGDCHTPRNWIGVPKQSLYMAGADEKSGPLGEAVPNITPDKETGIGDWKREDIAELLISGTKPDFDNVQGLMYEVIQGTPHGYKDMKKEDALAIADYLKTIPPIKNKVK